MNYDIIKNINIIKNSKKTDHKNAGGCSSAAIGTSGHCSNVFSNNPHDAFARKLSPLGRVFAR